MHVIASQNWSALAFNVRCPYIALPSPMIRRHMLI